MAYTKDQITWFQNQSPQAQQQIMQQNNLTNADVQREIAGANTRNYNFSTGTDESGSSIGSKNLALPGSISGQEKLDSSWVKPGYLDQVLEGYGAFVDPQTGVVMREETPGNPPVPVAFKLDGGKAGFIKNGEVIDSRLPFNDVKTGLGDYFGVLAKFGTMILGSAYLTPALTEALGAAVGGAASGAIQSTLQGGNPITGALRGGSGGLLWGRGSWLGARRSWRDVGRPCGRIYPLRPSGVYWKCRTLLDKHKYPERYDPRYSFLGYWSRR